MSSNNIAITDELVAEIADRMAEEGQPVSPVAIWSEVHTGSVVSVAASLRKWREARTPRVPQVVERPALPDAVTDTMRDALDRLWSSAQDEAERAVARRLSTMRQRVDDASNERDDALAELQNTVQELDTLQGQLDRVTSAYEAKVDVVAGLEEDIALAVQRTDAAEKRVQELADRVAALEAELETAMAELTAEREARAAAEAQVAPAAVEAVEAVETVEAPQEESAADEPAAVEAADTVDHEAQRTALEAAHAEAVARLESEVEAIRAALQAEQEAHAAQREEVSGAQAARDAAALELRNVQAQLASLADERDAGASEIARLSASLTEVQEHAAELAQSVAASQTKETEEAAPAVHVDEEALEALKAQLAQEAQTHAAALAEAHDNLKKWSDYANGLKQQLVQANEQMMLVHARGVGEASLSRRLAAELVELSPENELLRKEAQQRVIVEAMSAQLAQQGYHYDVATGAVTKLSTEGASA
ncbi:plasmid replication DNA-binding protein KfrA [Paraburkholderia eburnea]|uniref:Plasmid replication DNA-binding protein KfrA n=1 Tax=Paraburkholderia eburnea TaxID=1189126 RepID=A0A2S4LYQ8_9BURK|nr:DNA-binding protein [Paraburkholderia eburnea]POR47505.1 plasmid replication DNA-binding protein KfrA [Paraburkholderia eburnea]PRZ19093.1 plasmid replication DNA-binding protein KfrA [Paraburkholderia eburnea]